MCNFQTTVWDLTCKWNNGSADGEMSFHPRVWGLVLMDMIRSQISGMSCLSKSLCCTPAANVGPGIWLGYLPWCFSLVLFRTKLNGRRVRDWWKVCFGCLFGLIVSCFHNGCMKSSACISWWVNNLDTAFTFFLFFANCRSYSLLCSSLVMTHSKPHSFFHQIMYPFEKQRPVFSAPTSTGELADMFPHSQRYT